MNGSMTIPTGWRFMRSTRRCRSASPFASATNSCPSPPWRRITYPVSRRSPRTRSISNSCRHLSRRRNWRNSFRFRLRANENAQYLRYAASVERTPHLRRPCDSLEQAGLVDRLVLGRTAKDRIVAVKDRFHVDIGARYGVVGVVTHPLAERAFLAHLPRHRLAFDSDLAIGRDRKPGVGTPHHVDRLRIGANHCQHHAETGRRKAP